MLMLLVIPITKRYLAGDRQVELGDQALNLLFVEPCVDTAMFIVEVDEPSVPLRSIISRIFIIHV